MSRIRYIKPEFFKDTILGEMSRDVRLFYIGLWTEVDRNGVCELNPKFLKAAIFPYDEDVNSSTVLDLVWPLISTGRLLVCEFGGKKWLQCINFSKHQHVHHKENIRHDIPLELFVNFKSLGLAPDLPRSSTGLTRWVIGNGELVIGNGELGIECAKPKKKQPPKAATGLTPVAQIGRLFKSEYLKRFGHEYPMWGAGENSMAAHWLKSISIERALDLIPKYFAWNDPFVVKAGHPFEILKKQTPRLVSDLERAGQKVIAQDEYKEAQEKVGSDERFKRILKRKFGNDSQRSSDGHSKMLSDSSQVGIFGESDDMANRGVCDTPEY